MSNYKTTLKENDDHYYPYTALSNLFDSDGAWIDNQLKASDLNILKNGKIDFIQPKICSVTIATTDWDDFACTKVVTGITPTMTIIAVASPASLDEYLDCAVRCTNQALNSLTFACDELPQNDITVNILCLNAVALN